MNKIGYRLKEQGHLKHVPEGINDTANKFK